MARETAARVPLAELEKADVMEAMDDFSGNYALTKSNFRVSRANIWGIVLRKGFEQSNDVIELNDFTGKMKCIVPAELIGKADKISIGEPIQVIGKLRDRNGAVIFAESLRQLRFSEELLKRADNIYSLRNLKEHAKEGKSKKETNEASKEIEGNKGKAAGNENKFEEEGIVIERRKI